MKNEYEVYIINEDGIEQYAFNVSGTLDEVKFHLLEKYAIVKWDNMQGANAKNEICSKLVRVD